MKLAILADIHLDTPFAQLSAAQARRRRRGIQDALRAAIDRSAAERVEAILVAGDLYEHDRISLSPETQNFLRDLFGSVAPTPVLISPGNHDWLGPKSLYDVVRWTENVWIFRQTRLEPVELVPGITVWGAAHHAPTGTTGFLERFRVDRDGVNLALFHGSEQSGFAFQGDDKKRHGPFTAAQIEESGLDHAFVGHYHSPVDGERHTYPGNPEPLSFGEDGMRGLVLVDVHADGSLTRERIVVSQTRVFDKDVEVTGCSSNSEIRERVRLAVAGLSGYVRVTLAGELHPDVSFLPGDVSTEDHGLDALVVRVSNIQTGYDLETLAAEKTVRGQFVQDVLTAPLDEETRRRVIATGLRALAGRADLEVVG